MKLPRREELREELLLLLNASRELAPTEDQQLVEVFLDHVDAPITEPASRRSKDVLHGMPRGMVAMRWVTIVLLATLLVVPVTFIRQDTAGMHIAVAPWFYLCVILAVGMLFAITWIERHAIWAQVKYK